LLVFRAGQSGASDLISSSGGAGDFKGDYLSVPPGEACTHSGAGIGTRTARLAAGDTIAIGQPLGLCMRHIENIEQFGFEITPAVFSQAECDSLIEELSVLETKRTRAGARHLMSHPFVARIANDERVRGIAAAVLGPGALPYRATLFDKSAESNWSVVWHQDTALPLELEIQPDFVLAAA
jgi:hypothetical protein